MKRLALYPVACRMLPLDKSDRIYMVSLSQAEVNAIHGALERCSYAREGALTRHYGVAWTDLSRRLLQLETGESSKGWRALTRSSKVPPRHGWIFDGEWWWVKRSGLFEYKCRIDDGHWICVREKTRTVKGPVCSCILHNDIGFQSLMCCARPMDTHYLKNFEFIDAEVDKDIKIMRPIS